MRGRLGRTVPGLLRSPEDISHKIIDCSRELPLPTGTLIGKSVPRKEGRDKVTGRSRYIDDLVLPEMIYGATIRSQSARGKIKHIRFGGKIPWHEFTVVKASDIPGANYVALILNDQPYLADQFINHPEEAVVLIAHPDKHLLEEARRHVTVEVEALPAVFTIEDALAKTATIWGDDNVFKDILINQGDVDAAMMGDVIVVEGTYRTGAQEQLYIEPNGMVAAYSASDGVTIWGSLQCPYYIQKALKPLFNLPDHKVRVIQMETGGGFGGKEEYPSMIAGHAALLAYKAKCPVKLIYDRAEDMVATTKRHPSRTKHRTAVTRDGRLVAMDIEFMLDGGAYATLSAVVLSRGAIHAAGPYLCPNVRVRSKALATNTPPQGAFRGFGAPQSVFAIERHFDKVAIAVGLSPVEFRQRNFLAKGLKTATNQEIKEDIDMPGILARALQLSDYERKQQTYTRDNQTNTRTKRGIGFASFMHGAGFTGSGEKMMLSEAAVEATPAGIVRVLASSTEIGQGTNSIFSQIVGDVLGLPYDQIEVVQPDTAVVPNSGPTVASRTVMIVGKLVEAAAFGLKQQLISAGLLGEAYSADEFRAACAAHHKKVGPVKFQSQYKQPPGIEWDDKNYSGEAYATYAWAVYVADLEVDCDTLAVTVNDFVAVQEAGRIVHPLFAAGQIEGGVAQGIGFALYEKVVWREGRMINNQMTNYIMPTAADTPPIRVEFMERDTPYGPGRGAKGIGELPLDGTAPAIANALSQALGIDVDEIPVLPEDLFKAMKEAKSHGR